MFMNIVTLIIIVVTCGVSIMAFNNRSFFDRYKFSTYAITDMKQVDRLLSSGFLHADFMHLFFNMLTLYFFSNVIIQSLGTVEYISIYLASILGGNLLTLWMYRRDMTYTAVGASGGVSGILFASVALYPGMKLMMFPLPIPLPGWVFAIAYLAYSVYGMRSALGNIGHAAHLGGAVVGFVAAIVCYPEIIEYHGDFLALMAIPLIALGYFVYKEK
jgi:Uncharacterized membrane protein (homolog of Drosophila rhomboid)